MIIRIEGITVNPKIKVKIKPNGFPSNENIPDNRKRRSESVR